MKSFLMKSKAESNPFLITGYQYAILSIKLVLSKLFRQYFFETDLKMSDLELKFEVTLKLSNKNPVRVERRTW